MLCVHPFDLRQRIHNEVRIMGDCSHQFVACNRPLPISFGSLYQNEVKCSAFDVEMIFHSPANKTRTSTSYLFTNTLCLYDRKSYSFRCTHSYDFCLIDSCTIHEIFRLYQREGGIFFYFYGYVHTIDCCLVTTCPALIATRFKYQHMHITVWQNAFFCFNKFT